MGVAPVDGYGNINAGNAKEIYAEWRKGNIELSTSQQKYVQTFLTPEEKDEVDYDDAVIKKDGESAIDTKGAEGGTPATAVASTAASVTSVGGVAAANTIVPLVAGTKDAEGVSKINGFVALACAIASIGGAAAALALSFRGIFDPDSGERGSHQQANGDNVATVDGYNQALVDTMDAMNEDMAAYEEGSNNLALNVNDVSSQMANLQVELAAAQAAGDKTGAEQIKAQIESLKGTDFSGEQGALTEIGDRVEIYRDNNVEAAGVASSGRTVSDFLKVGNTLNTLAVTNGTLLGVGAIAITLCAAFSLIPKVWTIAGPVDLPAGIKASALWYGMAVLWGAASAKMFANAHFEHECGEAGEELGQHVSDLDAMITEQADYTETTAESFGESDAAAAEIQEEGSEASGTVPKNNGVDNPEIFKPITPEPTPTGGKTA